jgi:hypothetical protein
MSISRKDLADFYLLTEPCITFDQSSCGCCEPTSYNNCNNNVYIMGKGRK